MAPSDDDFEDAEYPGVRWVLAHYILNFVKDGQPMPRCQDLPAKAFGSLRKATRVFAVTHPWLGQWQPDPQGIQVETLRAKLLKMKKQLMLDQEDVVFLDYMCLPQRSVQGADDRSLEEKERFRKALSGDLMGRIYLTTRVIVIDEVPKEAESNVPYPDRGWCFFECMVSSMNTFPRDVMWVTQRVKDDIARFRTMSGDFRDSGNMEPLLAAFDGELEDKRFTNKADADLVRGFFISLARSQRLISAAASGDVAGCVAALDDGADPYSRNGQGRTALHCAALNQRVGAVAAILKRTDTHVVTMKTMENETTLDVATQGGSRECQVLIRNKLGEDFPTVVVKAVEGDAAALRRLLFLDEDEVLALQPPKKAAAGKAASNKAASLAAPAKAASGSAAGSIGKAATTTPSISAALAERKKGSTAAAVPKATASGKAKAAAGGKALPPARSAAMKSAGSLVLERSSTPTAVSPGSASSGLPEAGSSDKSTATKAAAVVLGLGSQVEGTSADGQKAKPGFPKAISENGAAASGVEAVPRPGLEVDEADDAGYTALFYAASLQYLPIVELLLTAKADMNRSCGGGETPFECVKRMELHSVLALLQAKQRTEGATTPA
eukprot:TRINITY_DN80799_c0_g1_i1.p1 TRINITY_DN80799_c0_g1~~TRINITY_DN80799_c0_g1_i1.p1  ORF type:complete len:611 (-),score=160.13 TRINITY_DN80799_c0_g1_i1:81-1913(-)